MRQGTRKISLPTVLRFHGTTLASTPVGVKIRDLVVNAGRMYTPCSM